MKTRVSNFELKCEFSIEVELSSSSSCGLVGFDVVNNSKRVSWFAAKNGTTVSFGA